MRHAMFSVFSPSVVFLPQTSVDSCRCGAPSLQEACTICEQLLCQDCAAFVHPKTQAPIKPSELIGKRLHADFLAHRGCVVPKDSRLFPCVYPKDVPLMIQIIKGGQLPGLHPKANRRA